VHGGKNVRRRIVASWTMLMPIFRLMSRRGVPGCACHERIEHGVARKPRSVSSKWAANAATRGPVPVGTVGFDAMADGRAVVHQRRFAAGSAGLIAPLALREMRSQMRLREQI